MNKEQAEQAANELLNLLPREEFWEIHVGSTFNDKNKDEHDFYIATDELMICIAKKSEGKYKVHGFGRDSINDNPIQAIKDLLKSEQSRHKKALKEIAEVEETLFPTTKCFVDEYPHFFKKDDPAVYIENGWDSLVMDVCHAVEGQRAQPIMLINESFDCPPNGLFDFKFNQIKEKNASLTIYYDISSKNLDWNKFCKEEYEIQFARAEGYIRAVVDQAKSRSNSICEYTGKPGRHYSVNGWDKILCEEKARELGAV